MKVEKASLPLMAALFFIGTGNSIALAGSMLDPYQHIKAPTTAERQQQVTGKKKGLKLLKRAPKKQETALLDVQAPAPKANPKPATVILSQNSPKLEEEKVKPAPVVKTASSAPDAGSSADEGGFLAGIKQSTGGIAKSTKAVGSGVVNGTKNMGSKIASGFKVAGEKVKDGTVAAGEKMAEAGGKVKESGSGMGGKVAGGLKTAGGAVAALPKAVGEKLGGTGEGAKKLAAAPVAGLAAIGHGMSKLNPFHKDDSPAIAKKPELKDAKGGTAVAAAPKPTQSLVPEKPTTIKEAEEAELAKANSAETEINPEKIAETGGDPEKSFAQSVIAKTKEPANDPEENFAKSVMSKATVAKAPEKTKDEKSKDGKAAPQVAQKNDAGLTKKIAAAPMAGLTATKAGIDKTKAGIGVIGHGLGNGFGKLNPFHRGDKTAPAPQATAAKPKVKAEAASPVDKIVDEAKQELETETAAAPPIVAPTVETPTAETQPQIGERIEMPENAPAPSDADEASKVQDKVRIAPADGAVPQ